MPNGDGKGGVRTGVATQALGFIEEKLRRVFRIAGPIGCDLDPVVKPVIIADDLRDPGHAFFQGRSFAWSLNQTGVAAGVKAVQLHALNDVILEGFWFTGPVLPATAFVTVYVGSPLEAVPNNAEFLVGAWRDNRVAVNDQPPMQAPVALAALTGTGPTTGNAVWVQGPGSLPPGFVPMKIYLPSGGWLGFQTQDVVTIGIGTFGRIFPQ